MKKTGTAPMTVELPVQLKNRLEELAKSTDCSSADLALDAISCSSLRALDQIAEYIARD